MNELFAALYEGFHPLDLFYIDNFSNDMFSSGAYVTIGCIMLLSTFIMESVYYYFISSFGNLFRVVYWFIWLAVIALINFLVAYYFSTIAMQDMELEYGFNEYFYFSIVNVLWAMLFSFIFSLILKFKSVKGSRTPF